MHTTIRRLRQHLAQEGAVRLFQGADTDASGDLSMVEFESAFGTDIDAEVVRQLFCELDHNNDSKISFQEFEEGLQRVPVTDDLGVLKSLLNSLNLSDLIAPHLMEILHQRLGAGEDLTTDAVRWHMRDEDTVTALQVCLCAVVYVHV